MSLDRLKPHHATLVGIDSDGCVFDSMTVKQVQCFHPAFLDQWGLWGHEAAVRECLEHVNLFSQTRGQDRFVCLLLAVERMRLHPAIPVSVELPDLRDLGLWLESGPPFGNGGLEAALQGAKGDALRESASLREILDWSRDVDDRVANLAAIPPFPDARRFIEGACATSDLIVVSSTPLKALEHEWEGCGLRSYLRFICSKDIGTKLEHLQAATADGRYDLHQVLMVGDAPKDLESAREAGVRFYPVNPGQENDSWARLIEEVYPAFIAGNYSREREEALVREFLALLP
jgi:phosphoglycolate phosphatase-like HAD superfamily hydrolase